MRPDPAPAYRAYGLASEATPSDTGRFRVLLVEEADEDLVFTFDVNVGTTEGQEDGDFTLNGATLDAGSASGTVTVPAHEAAVTIEVTSVVGDGDVGDETVELTLNGVSNTDLCRIEENVSASILIIDNGLNP